VSRYQKGKINLDFTEARDSEWQWHPLDNVQGNEVLKGNVLGMCNVQVCTALQTDNHASTLPLSFLQAGCPSCRPTNNVKALTKCRHLTVQKVLKRFMIPLSKTKKPSQSCIPQKLF